MLIAIIPLLMIIIGLLLWFVSSNPKVSEAGKLVFFAGTLALAMHYSGQTFRLG